jgi:hypothetical protein
VESQKQLRDDAAINFSVRMGLHTGEGARMSAYQVVPDGLPAEFPMLLSIDYFMRNLPQQLSSLVGNKDVVAELTRSSRLIKLSGVGGVGKTCLAHDDHIAARQKTILLEWLWTSTPQTPPPLSLCSYTHTPITGTTASIRSSTAYSSGCRARR